MATVNKDFIVKLKGKDFVTYEGLLDTAHQMGLIGISTEVIELPSKDNNGRCIMKAIAKTEKGQFEGYGDADLTNVNKMIVNHIIRMAETRAKARALRDLTNIGMTAIEELGGEDHHEEPNIKTNEGTISEGQAKRIFALSNGKADVCKTVIEKYGYKKSSEVKISDYNKICDEVQKLAK